MKQLDGLRLGQHSQFIIFNQKLQRLAFSAKTTNRNISQNIDHSSVLRPSPACCFISHCLWCLLAPHHVQSRHQRGKELSISKFILTDTINLHGQDSIPRIVAKLTFRTVKLIHCRHESLGHKYLFQLVFPNKYVGSSIGALSLHGVFNYTVSVKTWLQLQIREMNAIK